MPSRPVVFQRWPPSRYRNSRVVYGPRLERRGEVGDPVVVADELFFAGVGVVDAIDPFLGQRRVVGVRRADVVALAARFVQIVIQVGAGRDEAVDVAVRDQVRDDQPQAAGAQRAGHARGRSSRRPPASSARCGARWRGCGPETRSAPCATSISSAVEPGFDGERLDRRLQEARLLLHARLIKASQQARQARQNDRPIRRTDRRSTRDRRHAPRAVVSPGGADGGRERERVAGDEVGRQLAADETS